MQHTPPQPLPADTDDVDDIHIELQNVTKGFGDGLVLDGVNLQVRRGERLCVLGPSGSGKSTVMEVMTGELRPAKGAVLVNGKNICSMSDRELNAYRKTIGVAFQHGALFNSMTVADNIALMLREHTDLDEETIAILVKMKLELVGLRPAASKMPAELSGGMRKRAGIARAMALDPRILFYDEPSSGLDPVTVAQVDALITQLNEVSGITSVVITHDMASARRIAHRLVLLNGGKFVACGSPEQLENSDDPLVQQFMHGEITGPLTDQDEGGAYEKDLLSTPEVDIKA